MSSQPLATEGTGYEVVDSEPPDMLDRNLRSGSILLVGATAFFFLCFLFAFFYLRALNNADMWKPKGVHASVAWGVVVAACYVASALLVRLGLADHRALRRGQWRLKGLLALVAVVAGLVLQVVAWTQQSFGPADGGYASVYYGWTAFLFLFVLGTAYWLETTLATSYRYRHSSAGSVPAGHASGDPDRDAPDILDPVSLVRGELVALSFYWMFLAGIAVLAWVVLYLV